MRTKEEILIKIVECQMLLDDIEVLINCCATGVDCRKITDYKFKATNDLNLAADMDIEHWYHKEAVVREAKSALEWVLNIK